MNRTKFKGFDFKRLPWAQVLAAFAALGIYFLALVLPIPAAVGLFVRSNLVVLAVIALPAFYFAFKVRGALGTFLSLTVSLLLVALSLSGLWRSGASEPFIIGGLLPFSDAASYYSDALRVTEGFRFSAFSARRPLFPALLTVLLAVTGQNLLVSLAILGVIIAGMITLAARALKNSWGALPAAVFAFTLFLFYRRIGGTTMTENLGLPLGVAAFVILYSAARERNLVRVSLGLLLLTLALNARAGTFFVLPALVLWSGFAFRGELRFSWLVFGSAAAVVAAGFLLNMLVFKLIADPGGMVFSNFSYTLYGVVAGGKGWMQILIDHPELAQLDDVTRSARTYALVFETWKAQPFGIVVGALKNWLDYLLPRGAGAFGFIRGEALQGWVNYAVRIALSLLAAWGLVSTWRGRKTEPNAMLLWAALGIFLSVPFVPPNDSNQMRVYAATVPFLIAFCAIGMGSIIQLIWKKVEQPIPPANGENTSLLALGLILSLVTIFGSLLVRAVATPQALNPGVCPTGQTLMVARITPGTLVSVGAADLLSNQLNVPVESFVTRTEGYPEMHASLARTVEGGAVLGRSLNLINMEYPLVIFPAKSAPLLEGLVNICAIQPEDEELLRRGYWLEESVQPLGITP